jgi:glycosyltransferase involved in cell wall biosynthesis
LHADPTKGRAAVREAIIGGATDKRPVSVILTYYRADEMIDTAIQSVLAQTHADLELLLIDDNGPDASQISQMSEKFDDPRIRFLQNPNRGRAPALAFGVAQARHEICAIQDADDLWHPRKLEFDLAFLDRAAGVEFVCSRARLFSDVVDIGEPGERARLRAIGHRELLIRSPIIHASVAAYRDLLTYDVKLPYLIDYDLFLRLMDDGRKLYQIDRFLVGKRVHNSYFEARNVYRYYGASAMLQARHILRARQYDLLIFPLLRFLYTPFRRMVNRTRAVLASRRSAERPV